MELNCPWCPGIAKFICAYGMNNSFRCSSCFKCFTARNDGTELV